jgi:hypothetical protein
MELCHQRVAKQGRVYHCNQEYFVIVIIAEAKVARLHNRFLVLSKAVIPTTCGVAILVPNIIAHLCLAFLVQEQNFWN